MRLGLLLVGLAAITWGTTGAALMLLGASGNSALILLGAERLLVATPLLFLIARSMGPWRRPRGFGFVGAGAAMASFQVCYFLAVPRAGVATSALLSICSAPVFIALLARPILGEPIARARLIAVILGAVGAMLLVIDRGSNIGSELGPGALLALGAGFAYSLYASLTKRSLPDSDPSALTALTFFVAALALTPFVLAQPFEAIELAKLAWPTILYLGAVPTALAYVLFSTGLRRVPASSAAIAGLLEPITAGLLGVTIFAEQFGLIGGLGILMLLGAVVVTGRETAFGQRAGA